MAAGHDERPTPTRVTHRDVYEAVTDLRHEVQEGFVTKSELRMWVVLGLVGGQGVTAIVTQLATGMKPVVQAAWVFARIKGMA